MMMIISLIVFVPNHLVLLVDAILGKKGNVSTITRTTTTCKNIQNTFNSVVQMRLAFFDQNKNQTTTDYNVSNKYASLEEIL